MRFSVLGAGGFIGRALVAHLNSAGHQVTALDRQAMMNLSDDLGHVIYAVGVTGDFRTRPHATVDAHVSTLSRVLQNHRFDSLLYLSTTRVYQGSHECSDPMNEQDPLTLTVDSDRLYDLSKLTGESLCLAQSVSSVRVARLANVVGHGMSQHTFLGSVMRDVADSGEVVIGESPESSKDYVTLFDTVRAIEFIALHGATRLYNVASGEAITHGEIANVLIDEGGRVEFSPNGVCRRMPTSSSQLLRRESGLEFSAVLPVVRDIYRRLRDQPRRPV